MTAPNQNGTDASGSGSPSGQVGERAAGDLVTVAIPARNESASIESMLSSVLAQTHANLQVIVVDGDSTDDTARIVERVADRDPRVRLLRNPARVIPAAMNMALAAAEGRWFVRVDAHCRVPADYVEKIVERLASGRWGGVGGRKDGMGHTSQGRAIAAVMGSPFAQGNSIYHYGESAQTVDHVPFGAYPTALARELGGWAEDQLVNEDFEFDYRVRREGHDLLFDPEIRIVWDCRQSIVEAFRQYRRYGAGKVQTLVRHPESAAFRHLAAPGLVAMLSVAVALMARRRTRCLGVLLLVPYGLLVTVGSLRTIGRLERPGDRTWVPLGFLAIHLGWGIGFWEEALATLLGRGGPRRSLEAS